MKIYDQQLVEGLQAKEAAHTSIQKRLRHSLTRNCQTLHKRTTVQQTHLILKHVECLWREKVQRSSPKNTGRAEKATALLLEKGDLRGYPWEHHAKGATVHIAELAQTFHIGITWWSIGRYGISFVQASFFSFFQGGGVPLNSQIYTEICSNFVIFWMTIFLANCTAIQVKQNSHKLLSIHS